MIGHLRGRATTVRPGEIVLDAGGVGYRVATTLRDVRRIPDGGDVELWIHTLVREDRISLYGFVERDDLELFERLIGVSGIGPRIALAVLASLSGRELAAAVESGEAARLERIPGVGKKTAGRLVLELKGRLPEAEAPPDVRSDAVSALVNLGYSNRDAGRAVDGVEGADDLAELLREALKLLNR